MAVLVNNIAPDFSLVADNKETYTLSEHRDANLLVLFFPGAFTSPCTTELNAVSNDSGAYEGLNTQVVGISTDSPFVLSAFREQNGIGFPLLSDHNTTVCQLFGTKYGPGIFPLGLHRVSRRAAFVIDRSGVIRYAEVMENAGEMPNFDAVKQVLSELQD